MPEEHQRRAKERTARYLGSIMTFAAWSAALRPNAVPLRIALTQIAEELDCSTEEARFPAYERFMAEQKDGNASN